MRMNGFRYLRNSTLIGIGAAALAFACEGAPTTPTPIPTPLPDLATIPPEPDLAVRPPDMVSFPAPVVTSVAPANGANNTTTVITVNGQNFRQGATVTVGSMPCASPALLSPTAITCTVPARTGTCAAQNVVVTHPDDMKSGTGTGLFSYRTGVLGFVTGAPASYPTGTGPRRIVSADFDGDGNIDLAVANQTSNSITVLRGSATGTFPAATISNFNLPAGATAPQDLIAADLNGDNKVDLAVSNLSNNISVFLNTGTAFSGSNYNTTVQGSSLAAGDISGDGKVDLVVGQANAANVIAMLNNAAGTAVYTVGPARSVAGTVADVALADV